MTEARDQGRSTADIIVKTSAEGLQEVFYQPSRWAYDVSVLEENRSPTLPQ